jgi:diphthamide synthase (EF-2-diphthine--ammonia ligase)
VTPAGDILDVCNDFMGRATQDTGVCLYRPLWQLPRQALLETLWSAGIVARITCINLGKFGVCRTTPPATAEAVPAIGDAPAGECTPPDSNQAASQHHVQATVVDPVKEVLGAFLDRQLCSEEGALGRAHAVHGVDLCGENGETHSCVVACPLFRGRQVVLEGVTKQVEGEYAWLAVERALSTPVKLAPCSKSLQGTW